MKTVRELGRQLRTGEVSCVELTRRTLADIQARERFHSFITITAEQALTRAAELDAELAQGFDRGPWHGIPIAYKDIIYTQGVPTTGASLVYRDFVPQFDADVVTRFHYAGAVSIGKTNLHELAYGATSQNPHFGPVLNPHDPTRIPGGSSGGSAAIVAAGFLPMALGTDTGGSIRIPASYCGVVGLMPTYDRVSRRGVMPLSFSLDHVGPLAATVEDCALAMYVLEGGFETYTPLRSVDGLRVCLPKNFFFDQVDGEVADAVRRVAALLSDAGARCMEHSIPDLYAANLAARVIQLSEAAALYAHYSDPTLFGADVWALIQQGKQVAGYEYVNAQRLRTLFRREFNALWNKFDVIVAPSTPIVAPLLEDTTVLIGAVQEDTRMASTRLTRGIAFTGEPAISVPCGTSRAGMPIGLQLIARPGGDETLLQIAGAVERILRVKAGNKGYGWAFDDVGGRL